MYELQQLLRVCRDDACSFLTLLPRGIPGRVRASPNLSRNNVAVVALAHQLCRDQALTKEKEV